MVIAINERDHRLGNLDLAGNLAIGKNVFKNCCTQTSRLYLSFISPAMPCTAYYIYKIFKILVTSSARVHNYTYVCLHLYALSRMHTQNHDLIRNVTNYVQLCIKELFHTEWVPESDPISYQATVRTVKACITYFMD